MLDVIIILGILLSIRNDLLKPSKPGHFTKDLFLASSGKHAMIFFNMLLNLVKLVSFENRDMFQLKNIAT